MSREIIPLTDILTIEEIIALFSHELSAEIIRETFLADPQIVEFEYRKEEGRFYVTFADGDKIDFRFLLPLKEDA